MREIKLRYTFRRKEDGHIYQIITSVIGLEEGCEHLKSMLYDNDLWELIGRDEYIFKKDKNGVEIYENDTVVIKDKYPFYDEGKPNYIAVIEWIFSGFQIVLYCVNKSKRGISDGVNQGYFEYSEEYEVIGNIYENLKTIEE